MSTKCFILNVSTLNPIDDNYNMNFSVLECCCCDFPAISVSRHLPPLSDCECKKKKKSKSVTGDSKNEKETNG